MCRAWGVGFKSLGFGIQGIWVFRTLDGVLFWGYTLRPTPKRGKKFRDQGQLQKLAKNQRFVSSRLRPEHGCELHFLFTVYMYACGMMLMFIVWERVGGCVRLIGGEGIKAVRDSKHMSCFRNPCRSTGSG